MSIEQGHRWVGIAEAVGILGLSERTIRRHVAAGKLLTRTEAGRVEVRVEAAVVAAGVPDIIEGVPDIRRGLDRNTGTGVPDMPDMRPAGLAVVAEIRRARRHAAAGWSMAAAGFVLAAGLAVWGVRAIERAEGQAAAARAEAGIWRDVAAADRRRVDEAIRHQGERVVVVEADHQGDGWAGFPYPIKESVTIP